MKTSESLPTITTEKSKSTTIEDNNSSDDEFDVTWERRAKQKARKEAASAPPPSVESPLKRTVHFSPSTTEPIDLIELDLDETTQDRLPQTKDQNNNNKQQTEIVNLDDDDDETTDTQSQITTVNIYILESTKNINLIF
jgi:hypothetical protein